MKFLNRFVDKWWKRFVVDLVLVATVVAGMFTTEWNAWSWSGAVCLVAIIGIMVQDAILSAQKHRRARHT